MPRPTRNSQESLLPPLSTQPGTSTANNAAPDMVATILKAVQEQLPGLIQQAVADNNKEAPQQPAISTIAPISGTCNSTTVPAFANIFSAAGSVTPFTAPPTSLCQDSSLGVGPIVTVPPLPTVMSTAVGSSETLGATLAKISSPLLQQPFVVGPGYSPIPYKLVSQIVAGKFVEFAELLPENISQVEPEPQLFCDGKLVFAPAPKKPKRQIADIISWLEAFSIYTLVLCAYFPKRWRDLEGYRLRIIRSFRQFSGSSWLTYDKEYREHMAATRSTDWSDLNSQLFNFHFAGTRSRSRIFTSIEETGETRPPVICRSWNNGRCSVPSGGLCKYAHICSKCKGDHRVSECTRASQSTYRASSTAPEERERKRYRRQ